MPRFLAIVAVALAVSACAPGSVEETAPAGAPRPAAPESSPAGPPGTSIVSGMAPRATGEFASVVVLEPEIAGSSQPPDEPERMDQIGMAFVPPLLLVRAGQPVDFRNSEDVIHNVNAAPAGSTTTVFNIATVPFGSFRYVFETPGAYSIRCDVHLAMAAFVYVTDSPYAVVADRDGAFAIEDVPYGSYTLSLWNVAEELRRRQSLEVAGPETRVELEVSGAEVDADGTELGLSGAEVDAHRAELFGARGLRGIGEHLRPPGDLEIGKARGADRRF